MAWKFIRLIQGVLTETEAKTSSAGAEDSGVIPALDATGRLDMTFMPVGVQQERKILQASEALSAGDFVNIYDASGTIKCRKADAATNKRADGFVTAAVNQNENATIFLEGTNTQLSGLTGGKTYFLSHTVPGGVTDTPTSTAGHVVQKIGRSLSDTEISFEPGEPITLA